jgi:AbrB family looped-hinge helix DNA binding protein
MWDVMKKYPKVVQCDLRGQIVIPKEIRTDLGIEEGTGFYVYSVSNEGILLKKIDTPQLNDSDPIIKELKEKADKISIKKEKIDKTIRDYRKTKEGGLDLI